MEYSHDFGATGRFLRTDTDLADACMDAAADIRDMAAILAPRDTGAYADSLAVAPAPVTDRVGALVTAEDDAAAPLEFGNARTQGVGRNVLERAAETAGFEVGGS